MVSVRAHGPALASQTEPALSDHPGACWSLREPGQPGDSKAASGWQEGELTPWPAAACSQVPAPSLSLVYPPAPSLFCLPPQSPPSCRALLRSLPAGGMSANLAA